MSNMARTKFGKFDLYSGSDGRVYPYQPTKTVPRPRPPYKYTPPGKPVTWRPGQAPRPGSPNYVPRNVPGRPRPGSLAEAQANATFPPAGPYRYGKLFLRFGLQMLSEWMLEPGWAKQGSQTKTGSYSLPSGWSQQCQGCANPSPPYGCMGDPRESGKVYYDNASSIPVPINCGYANIYNLFIAPMGAVIPAGSRIVIEGWGPTVSPFPDPWATVTRIIGVPAGPHPGTVPVFQPGTNTLPVSDPFPYPSPMERVSEPQPWPSPRRLYPRYGVASMDIELPPRPGRPVRNPDSVHLRVPPRPNEKEDKFDDKTGRSVRQVYGALTELDDLLDCAQKSLKKNKDPAHRRRVPINQRLDLKTLRIAQEFASGNVDIPAFLECIAVSNFQDMVIGKTSGAASRNFNRNPYNPIRSNRGWGTGGFAMRMR